MDQALGRQDAINPQPREEQSGPGVVDEDIQPIKTESPDPNNPDLEKGDGGGEADVLFEDKGPRFVTVLGFRNLQLRRIAEKQDDLLRLAKQIASGSGEDLKAKNEEADEKLRSYCESVFVSATRYLLIRGAAQALRDYETLSSGAFPFISADAKLIGSMAELPWRQTLWLTIARAFPFMQHVPPFDRVFRGHFKHLSITTTSRAVQYLFREEVTPPTREQIEQTVELAAGAWGYRELVQRDPISSRLFMGVFGGTAVYLPILIMTVNPSTTKTLVTTFVAILLFGILLAIAATDSSGKDVLAATAAYAGILVVFAGALPIPG